MGETTKCEPIAALRSIRQVAADVLEHPDMDREKALRYVLRRASEALDAATGESAKERLRTLVLAACEDLGFHGLEPTPDAMAALSSLIVNASRLGWAVDATATSDDVMRLRALADDRSYGLHTPTREWLRDLADRLNTGSSAVANCSSNECNQ